MGLQRQLNKCRGDDNDHRLLRVCDPSREKLTTFRDGCNIISIVYYLTPNTHGDFIFAHVRTPIT